MGEHFQCRWNLLVFSRGRRGLLPEKFSMGGFFVAKILYRGIYQRRTFPSGKTGGGSGKIYTEGDSKHDFKTNFLSYESRLIRIFPGGAVQGHFPGILFSEDGIFRRNFLKVNLHWRSYPRNNFSSVGSSMEGRGGSPGII